MLRQLIRFIPLLAPFAIRFIRSRRAAGSASGTAAK